MTQRIEPFSWIWRFTRFWTRLKDLNLFFNVPQRIEPFFLWLWLKSFFHTKKKAHRIEPFLSQYDHQKIEPLFSTYFFKMIHWLKPFFSTWFKELNTFLTNSWLKVLTYPFWKIWLKELNILEYDSKNWTFFEYDSKTWTSLFDHKAPKAFFFFWKNHSKNFFKKRKWLKELNHLFNKYLFFDKKWFTDLNPSFQHDSKNWTLWKYDSQNWTLFSFQKKKNKNESMNWTFFEYDAKNRTLFQKWPLELNLFF